MKREHFECQYCSSKFVNESRFLKHECTQMKREKESKTPTGKSAWFLYQKWMQVYGRLAASHDIFLTSKYYTSFIKFAKFVKQANIPDVDQYIRLMKRKDISPSIWTRDEVYSLYLEFIDKEMSPQQLAKITITTLFDIAEALECDVPEIFDYLLVSDFIELLRSRNVSPWILLFSKRFESVIKNKTTAEERIILETLIRPKFWLQKFQQNPEIVGTMKKYVKELDI